MGDYNSMGKFTNSSPYHSPDQMIRNKRNNNLNLMNNIQSTNNQDGIKGNGMTHNDSVAKTMNTNN